MRERTDMVQPSQSDRRSDPYLSVVVTTRNDDHGGDPLKRLQAFVNAFDEQARRTGLDAEVIVVEWNPPPERPTVGALLRLPDPCWCTYRFVEVPPELHAGLRHADVLPLFQMIAKNVGIRRARGRFVLSTNIDIIFSMELVEYLASRPLQPGYLYRVDRHDIQADLPVDAPLEAQLAWAASHQLRVHTRNGSYSVDANGNHVSLAEDIVDGRTIRLGEGWHVREGGGGTPFCRWASDRAQLIVDPTAAGESCASVLDVEVEANPYDPRAWARVDIFDGDRAVSRAHIVGRMRLEVPLENPGPDGRHVVELRVTETYANARQQLPIFERRDTMQYRVYTVKLRRSTSEHPTMFEYPASGWANAHPGSALTLERTVEGLRVASDPRKWAYCVEYGPFRAPASGSYRFDIACSVLDGRVKPGVLSGGRHFWIPASIDIRQDPLSLRFDIRVALRRNELFWLMLFNDHPEGDGVSRFVVHGLSGSAAPVSLVAERRSRVRTNRFVERCALAYTRAVSRARRWWRGVAALPQRGREWLVRCADAIPRFIAAVLGQRLRRRIVRAAPEYRWLERALRASDEQLRAITPLRDLAPLHRFLHDRRPANLHLNGCGDFQLLAREHWQELRGYPEFETFSMNIDGLFSYITDAAGVKEQALAMPIYHLEHEVGSGWSPEGEALLRRRIAERGITWLDASTVYIWAAYMRWLQRPMMFNGPDWGMGKAHVMEQPSTVACRVSE
jgi:hypothetical protein